MEKGILLDRPILRRWWLQGKQLAFWNRSLGAGPALSQVSRGVTAGRRPPRGCSGQRLLTDRLVPESAPHPIPSWSWPVRRQARPPWLDGDDGPGTSDRSEPGRRSSSRLCFAVSRSGLGSAVSDRPLFAPELLPNQVQVLLAHRRLLDPLTETAPALDHPTVERTVRDVRQPR